MLTTCPSGPVFRLGTTHFTCLPFGHPCIWLIIWLSLPRRRLRICKCPLHSRSLLPNGDATTKQQKACCKVCTTSISISTAAAAAGAASHRSNERVARLLLRYVVHENDQFTSRADSWPPTLSSLKSCKTSRRGLPRPARITAVFRDAIC